MIPGLGRSPGEGKGYPLKYSGLENSLDSIVHGVAELDTTERLSHWWLSSKELIANARDVGSVPWSRRFPAEGNGNPL